MSGVPGDATRRAVLGMVADLRAKGYSGTFTPRAVCPPGVTPFQAMAALADEVRHGRVEIVHTGTYRIVQ